MKIVATSYYQYLLEEIYSYSSLPETARCEMLFEKFSDGEMCITFQESLRGLHLFIIGETSHSLTETLLIIDAAKRNSVSEITVILPYYGYSRQDKKEGGRRCIGSKMIAKTLENMGVRRVLTIDLHAEQIQGFFDIPVDHILGRTIFAKQLKKLITSNSILCSPDAGGAKRVDKFCKMLKVPMVQINKRRDKPGSVDWMELIGDVKDKDVFLIDDIMDSGGTLLKANDLLLEKGASSVSNIITHMVLSKPEVLLQFAKKGTKIYSTNTLSKYSRFLESLVSSEQQILKNNIEIFDCANLLAKTIYEIDANGSVTALNEDNDEA